MMSTICIPQKIDKKIGGGLEGPPPNCNMQIRLSPTELKTAVARMMESPMLMGVRRWTSGTQADVPVCLTYKFVGLCKKKEQKDCK